MTGFYPFRDTFQSHPFERMLLLSLMKKQRGYYLLCIMLAAIHAVGNAQTPERKILFNKT